MARAAVYVRISNDPEGQALGVARQEEDARALAERHGWDVSQVYSDNDISASGRKRRPAWERLMRDAKDGKVAALVAYSSSRLYRNLRDLSDLIELVDAGRLDIDTVVSGNINLTTADGRMLARILASVDQAEWERTSERVRRKRASLTAQGYWTGGDRPFGLRAVRDDGGARLEVEPTEASVIRNAASAVLNGVSLSSIARDWNRRGIRTPSGKAWTRNQLKRALSNRRLAPDVLVATDQDRVAEMFNDRRTGPAPEKYLLTGLLECGRCGAPMGGRAGRYICSASGRVHLAAVAAKVDYAVMDASAEHPDREEVHVHDPSEPLVREREGVVTEMEALGDSDLPDAVIRGRARKLQRRLDAIDAELDRTRPVSFFEELARPYDAAEHRRFLESQIERIVLRPAEPGANRFDPGRVQITWRL